VNEWEWNLLEDKAPVVSVPVAGVELRAGDRVRLHPRAGGDVLDLAMAGRTALVEAIEQDYEGELHLAVVLDDDPGRDLGLLRQPGHRFFFRPTEVEPLDGGRPLVAPDGRPAALKGCATGAEAKAAGVPTILVAGIGNIFMGDDAFGVEVAQRLARRSLPEGVRVIDFGIRGFDLACALVNGADVSILVDACPRGADPGTVCLIEPDLDTLDSPDAPPLALEGHGLDPLNVLRLAKRMDGSLKEILLVGCEPQTLGGENGHMGLSEPVEAAIDEAIRMIESVVARIRCGDWRRAREGHDA
jgi:hydrogenase maturation protease